MEFEKAILSASTLKEAKLLPHAQKAAKEPDTGITINVKSAYNVIRDCATIASNYLAIHAYYQLNKPLENLVGAFTKAQIRDFIKRAQTEPHTALLQRIILEDIKHNTNSNVNLTTNTSSVDNNDSDDVYGDYDSITETKTASKTPVEDILFATFKPTK